MRSTNHNNKKAGCFFVYYGTNIVDWPQEATLCIATLETGFSSECPPKCVVSQPRLSHASEATPHIQIEEDRSVLLEAREILAMDQVWEQTIIR